MDTIFGFHKCLTLIFLSLFACFVPSYGTETDVYCLKSFKDSIEDPFGYLTSSWDFSNYTEGFICRFTGVACWHPDENRVLNLKLYDMGLRGKFPLGLANCTSLTGLDLSSNLFSGPIPSDISTMLPFLTSLDLSSNQFSGEIPSSIVNISYLNELRLDNNQLRGEIPAQFANSERIQNFSVANNHLSGKVPEFLNSSVPAESFANNKGLCGQPLDPCKDGSVSLLKKKFGISFMSGFAVGYAAAFLFVIVAFMFVCVPKKPAKRVTMRRRNNRKKKEAVGQERREGLLPTNIISRSNNIKISNLEKLVTRMHLAEIRKATDNFGQDGVIGEGKMGTMYKATLPNGWFLAIKKLHYNQHFEDDFVSEIMVLGRLRHCNLATLLGFCIEKNERLLVYTYMPNGNLGDRLINHGPVIGESSEILSLDWPLRVKIALGIARGLAWLHNNTNFQVFHLNLSSKCILLDQNFEPKISNFADSKFKPTDLSSSSLYQSGEFSKSGFANKDVHDFGMILVEMITSNKAIAINPCNLYDAIDESLVGKGYDGEIYQLLRIALNCVDGEPNMIEVYKAIRSIWQSYELIDDSETWIPR